MPGQSLYHWALQYSMMIPSYVLASPIPLIPDMICVCEVSCVCSVATMLTCWLRHVREPRVGVGRQSFANP